MTNKSAHFLAFPIHSYNIILFYVKKTLRALGLIFIKVTKLC